MMEWLQPTKPQTSHYRTRNHAVRLNRGTKTENPGAWWLAERVFVFVAVHRNMYSTSRRVISVYIPGVIYQQAASRLMRSRRNWQWS